MIIIIFIFFIGAFCACKHTPTPEEIEEQKFQQLIDSFEKENKNLRYYMNNHGDSLFTRDLLKKKGDIHSFYQIPYVVLPYGKRSKELLEYYFKITDYHNMPPAPVLINQYSDSSSIFELNNHDYRAAYWLSIHNDTAEIVEVYGSVLSEEYMAKTTNKNVISDSSLSVVYYWYYPSKQRELSMFTDLKILNYTTQEKLTQHLSNYQIDWLKYLNLLDTLNVKGWKTPIAQQQLEQLFNKKHIALDRVVQTVPKRVPFIFLAVEDSMLRLPDYADSYRTTRLQFSYLDTIPGETDSLFLEFSMYTDQFTTGKGHSLY